MTLLYINDCQRSKDKNIRLSKSHLSGVLREKNNLTNTELNFSSTLQIDNDEILLEERNFNDIIQSPLKETKDYETKTKGLSKLNRSLLKKITAINYFRFPHKDNETSYIDIDLDNSSINEINDTLSSATLNTDDNKLELNNTDSKFNCEAEYFLFGNADDFKDGMYLQLI